MKKFIDFIKKLPFHLRLILFTLVFWMYPLIESVLNGGSYVSTFSWILVGIGGISLVIFAWNFLRAIFGWIIEIFSKK